MIRISGGPTGRTTESGEFRWTRMRRKKRDQALTISYKTNKTIWGASMEGVEVLRCSDEMLIVGRSGDTVQKRASLCAFQLVITSK